MQRATAGLTHLDLRWSVLTPWEIFEIGIEIAKASSVSSMLDFDSCTRTTSLGFL